MAGDPGAKGFDAMAWVFAYLLATLPAMFAGGAYWTAGLEGEAMPFLTFGFTAAAAVWLCGAWHAFTRRFGWASLSTYLLVGFVIGALVGIIVIGRSGSLIGAGVGLLGAIQGALFAWLIRRPDRDAPNPPTAAP